MFAFISSAIGYIYNGRTPLIQAAMNGNTEEVQRLMQAGVDVDKGDWGSRTALHFAACNYPEIVKLLIEAGANVNKADNDGNTALTWTARWAPHRNTKTSPKKGR